MRELEKVDVERWAREKQLREMDDMVGTFEREVGVSEHRLRAFPVGHWLSGPDCQKKEHQFLS